MAVMDEFDIFMDEESRRVSLDLVLAMAKAMSYRQFIFITPQSLRTVTPGDTVVIHKLRKPERTYEGRQQQTLD